MGGAAGRTRRGGSRSRGRSVEGGVSSRLHVNTAALPGSLDAPAGRQQGAGAPAAAGDGPADLLDLDRTRRRTTVTSSPRTGPTRRSRSSRTWPAAMARPATASSGRRESGARPDRSSRSCGATASRSGAPAATALLATSTVPTRRTATHPQPSQGPPAWSVPESRTGTLPEAESGPGSSAPITGSRPRARAGSRRPRRACPGPAMARSTASITGAGASAAAGAGAARRSSRAAAGWARMGVSGCW